MNRPCFALLLLLVALAGPLYAANTAWCQSCGQHQVCTPPAARIHPADDYCQNYYAGNFDEYDLGAADEEFAGEEASEVEDWRDFVQEEESSLSDPGLESVELYQRCDELFHTLDATAERAIHGAQPIVQEVDESNYRQECPTAPRNDPYGALEPIDEAAADAAADYADQWALEAYEAEFSGYGTTEYFPGEFGDEFDSEPLVDPSPVLEIRDADWLEIGLGLSRDVARACGGELIQDWLIEARDIVQGIDAAECLKAFGEASDLAWDRIEERNRLEAQQRLAAIQSLSDGYRLPEDDCGWDCRYDWRSLYESGLEMAAAPQPSTPLSMLEREALLTLARSMRSLAGQLEAASNWIARMGGIDVAEIESEHTAR
jgi:hypothetical protein